MKTDFDTLRSLARFTINHLSEKKYIDFSVENKIFFFHMLIKKF